MVGLPLHLDGRISEKAREALAFGAWLSQLTGLPVDYMDERFTSVEAGYYLREAKMTVKQRKKRTDKIAAQILLANYIERGCRGTDVPVMISATLNDRSGRTLTGQSIEAFFVSISLCGFPVSAAAFPSFRTASSGRRF